MSNGNYIVTKYYRGVSEKETPCRTGEDIRKCLPAKAKGSVNDGIKYLELRGNAEVTLYSVGEFRYTLQLKGVGYGDL